MDSSIEYKRAGVDTEKAREIPDRLYSHMQKTIKPWFSVGSGGFSSVLDLSKIEGADALGRLALTCDGVGTKILLATNTRHYHNLGIDAVAMCVNDLLVVGARPLAVLDYVAMGSLDEDKLIALVGGISDACASVGAVLSGGETAEMPDVYAKDDFDIACFAVGLLGDAALGSEKIQVGDKIVGFPSSGLHSNGFSLVRHAVSQGGFDLDGPPPFISEKETLREALLEPTKLYHLEVLDMLLKNQNENGVRAMAHITGGGLFDNLERVIPKDKTAKLDRNAFELPTVFRWLRDGCGISEQGLWASVNMGIGLVAVVRNDFHRQAAIELGEIVANEEQNARVQWL